jgi:hypothetical protein
LRALLMVMSLTSVLRGNFKTSSFAQSLLQAQILILEIPQVFLRLKSSPLLTLDKIEHFETTSLVYHFNGLRKGGVW